MVFSMKLSLSLTSLGLTLLLGTQVAYADIITAKVIHKVAVYREVRIETPRQECRDVEVNKHEGPSTAASVTGTVIGGVLGGVLGHQVGGGRGKDIATAVGAVAGAAGGHEVVDRADSSDRVVHEQQCTKVIDSHTERQLDGYDLDYKLGGKVYHTHAPYDPGSTIPVEVTVTPRFDNR